MPENRHTIEQLQELQALPLRVKIMLTKARIRDWINEFGRDGVYVSFSGGKDSTVLLDIVRQDNPDIPAVFVDTGLEFPEIRGFVRLFDNVTWVKPKMNFRQVIEKYGYPMISKETSECVAGARKYLTRIIDELQSGERTNERTNERRYSLPINANSKEITCKEKYQYEADRVFGWGEYDLIKRHGLRHTIEPVRYDATCERGTGKGCANSERVCSKTHRNKESRERPIREESEGYP